MAEHWKVWSQKKERDNERVWRIRKKAWRKMKYHEVLGHLVRVS